MLTLSADATEAIKQVVDSTEAGQNGGIRFSITPVDEDQAKLELSVAASPEPGDTRIEEQGAKVYLDPNVVPLLEDKILDGTIESGNAAFTILDRPDAATL
jgi:Fe-S cluster assembly iron-binding protein IscA